MRRGGFRSTRPFSRTAGSEGSDGGSEGADRTAGSPCAVSGGSASPPLGGSRPACREYQDDRGSGSRLQARRVGHGLAGAEEGVWERLVLVTPYNHRRKPK